MVNLDKVDRDIIKLVQADMPISERPYKALSDAINISEQEIVERIKVMHEKGIIRRMGAVLRHQKAGYTVNAMVAWKINSSAADKAGEIMAGYKEISHCYFREVPESFPYPLFTMIHARTEEQMERLIDDIAAKTEIHDFVIIKSKQELKKTSMQYFEI
ncbi:heme biosynthesis protein [hydrocarbon metagenome]|uniref:siroheme decarboxylase n=1 Tax=hydrocarbon metagenome TaxID=938273 RepID=A0A0W8E7W1_9ZZZZ